MVSDFSSCSIGNYGGNGTVENLCITIATSVELRIPKAWEGKIRKFLSPRGASDHQPRPPVNEKRMSLRQKGQVEKSRKKLDTDRTPVISDKPHYYYIDFICQKTDEIRQDDSYVRVSMDRVLNSGILTEIKEIEWWSDGAGKVRTNFVENANMLAFQDLPAPQLRILLERGFRIR